jgi:hypothetical protein
LQGRLFFLFRDDPRDSVNFHVSSPPSNFCSPKFPFISIFCLALPKSALNPRFRDGTRLALAGGIMQAILREIFGGFYRAEDLIPIEEIERDYARYALGLCGGDASKAAHCLEIPRLSLDGILRSLASSSRRKPCA